MKANTKNRTGERQLPYPVVEDWAEETNYPQSEGVTYRQLAWEFLRRNPAYQKAVMALCDIENLEETRNHYLLSTSPKHFADRFFVATVQTPLSDTPPEFIPYDMPYYVEGPAEAGTMAEARLQNLTLNNFEFLFKADLRQPDESIKANFESVLKKIRAAENPMCCKAAAHKEEVITHESVRTKNPFKISVRKLEDNEGKIAPTTERDKKQVLINYLRMLDGDLEGADPTQIGLVLFKKELESNDWQYSNASFNQAAKARVKGKANKDGPLDKARGFRDRDYQTLIVMAEREDFETTHSEHNFEDWRGKGKRLPDHVIPVMQIVSDD